MAVRTGFVAGVPCRLFRVSFTGELGYEINVPADYGRSVWERALRARPGLRHHALRHRDHARAARRARLHHRRAGDGRHGDAGRSRPRRHDRARRSPTSSASARSPGRTSSAAGPQAARRAPDRQPERGARRGRADRRDPNQPIPMRMLGHVTSSYWSAELRPLRSRSPSWPAAAPGWARRSTSPRPRASPTARVAEPVFFDPKGERVHA